GGSAFTDMVLGAPAQAGYERPRKSR
ncbi:MAG TPA: GntR family transcriptional regulator, partial [Delftia acidovorans]|nr:GntR family transcriptional regulator [Delftia acidovorans]